MLEKIEKISEDLYLLTREIVFTANPEKRHRLLHKYESKKELLDKTLRESQQLILTQKRPQ